VFARSFLRPLHLPLKDYLLAALPGMSRRKLSEAALFTPRVGLPLAGDLGWPDGYRVGVWRCQASR
jgi:hypothetical protein